MATIDNRSGFPHAWVEKTGPGGIVYDVLAVRGTFDFAAGEGAVARSPQQMPIVYGDEYDGAAAEQPLRSVLRREGDLALLKPATDVYLTGTARATDGIPQRTWVTGLRVGPVRKVLRLHGPRSFERAWGRWRLSSAEPTDFVPLDYRYAFGGSFLLQEEEEAPATHVYKRDNPAGCGWLPGPVDLKDLSKPARKQLQAEITRLKRLKAPQIEAMDQPVRHPDQPLAAQGFGPLPRWCQPRLQHAGTYDERWQAERYPLLPEDFDPRFYQSAPPDLICPGFLAGDEAIVTMGLLPEGAVAMRLPGEVVLAAATGASGKKQAGPMVLDTVAVDLDVRQVHLVWRGTFERDDPIQHVSLGSINFAEVSGNPLAAEKGHG
ncbi:DUF2169 family type VI secretion system accessory protein [Xanthomonas cerealis]|uniref:DUF2169 family type VI secretion system accessory protein n=1 Tax=Xanthomonas cerealis TaxID=3390025 RepID=UPI00068B85FA|nr:DUF2169 domain-containing protein [Xanthomonas translucens]UKE46266.1 DUF2169 domain-containing protein [Xanthomonas translucens pv. cerealis]